MITQKELKDLLHYEPETGTFTWKSTGRGRSERVGYVHKKTGYDKVKINKKEYALHRLAWLYMKGYTPEYHIDHMNGVRDDNRWENLRHVTRVCNMQNQKVRADNTSGFPGVVWNKRDSKWYVQIQMNNRNVHLGIYDSALEAALARYTVEVQCPKWVCNYRSELVKAIQREWQGFKIQQ